MRWRSIYSSLQKLAVGKIMHRQTVAVVTATFKFEIRPLEMLAV
jgi:hypothetical protein